MELAAEEKNCCISHLFFRAASRFPNKLAVIHGSGGFQICRKLHEQSLEVDLDDEQFFSSHRVSSSPPVYPGDECYTLSEILASVDSIGNRIRRVLAGGDCPDLIRPRGYVHGEQRINTPTESSKVISENGKELSNFQSMHPTVVPSLAGFPQIVGIFIVPSVEYIVAVLAVLRSGVAFLPLDPIWPKERILSIVSSSKIDLIIKCSPSSASNDNHQFHEANWLVESDSFSVLNISMNGRPEENTGLSNLVWPCESKTPRLFCYLMYTSGSTGKPKGVCGTEKGLLNRFLWMETMIPMHGEDILLFKTSVSFIDHLQEILSAVLTGTPLIVPPFNESKANPFYLVDIVKAYHVTRLTAVPSLVRAILPALQCSRGVQVQKYIQVLLLSGEVLPMFLCDVLCKLLPKTSILNLYGSTEVSGDCTFFDCKNLPKILETEVPSSVPIGVPIPSCEVVLCGELDVPDEGEICVGGACVSVGYLFDPTFISSDYLKLQPTCGFCYGDPTKSQGTQIYFRTGDFARRLQSGNFVFLGRKDRIIKVNGQRVALEEIENSLRKHPNVDDAAVTFRKDQGENTYITAFVVMKSKDRFTSGNSLEEQFHHASGKYISEGLSSSFRSWLGERLPSAMIPNQFFVVISLPISSTGKIDYTLLGGSTPVMERARNEVDEDQCKHGHLEIIKEAFRGALMVEEVADCDDFFAMGGNSIGAAQVAHMLGIDMRLLYTFSSPFKLLKALLEGSSENIFRPDLVWGRMLKLHKEDMPCSSDQLIPCNELHRSSFLADSGETLHSSVQKLDKLQFKILLSDNSAWVSSFYLPTAVSYSRSNKVMYDGELRMNTVHQACWMVEIGRNRCGSMQQLWKVFLKSCVDASPLVVLKDANVYLFIGSHSHIFLCVNGLSGSVLWEVELEGRVECSAAITDDFSQVVVGCYKGKIYFLDFMTGDISWAFQTGGEVKSQPVADKCRSIVWCGSHDQNLYALDYKQRRCIYTLSCGGSIYGSPIIDGIHRMLYVASTSGRVTAISLETLPFSVVWLYESGAPIFGSLTINSSNGNVICCLVNGRVVALNSNGSVIWKAITDGPIFAGACISRALLSQVLICTRNGTVYSFELEGGDLLWKYHVGDPITSSAYIDENTQLVSETSQTSDRLVCVCSSSGRIHVLRIDPNAVKENNRLRATVFEFANMELPGEIFSSPVMIGGRIFVGCRDDHVYSISIIDSSH